MLIKDKFKLVPTVFCTIFLFLLYLSMLSKDYSTANFGADGGDFLSAILTNGIPHPSGYPAYLLVGKLFQTLPIQSPYLKGSILSAFFSALSVGLVVYYFGYQLQKNGRFHVSLILATIVGIALGISPLFWSQAVIVEVYGLTAFFFICIIIWINLILEKSRNHLSDVALIILSLVIGIGFGTHLMLTLMIPVQLTAAISVSKNSGKIKKIIIAYFGLMITGAILAYSILPFRARAYPPVNWGNPQTLSGFIWLVSGRLYQGLAFHIPPSEIFQRISYFATLLQKQYSFIGLFFGVMGIIYVATSQNRMRWVYLWVMVVYPVFSIGYLTNDSVIYLIPSFIIFSMLIGFGIYGIIEKVNNDKAILAAGIGLLFLSPLLVRFSSIKEQIDPRGQTSAKISAEDCLNSLPDNSILITKEDLDTFPIWYYHFGLDWRADIHVIVLSLLQFQWYRDQINHNYPEIKLPEPDYMDVLLAFKSVNQDLSICHTIKKNEDGEKFTCLCQ